ncbi:4'-phosphopantetheinyl transferase superfamily protein [bacterium]|nr:4'-phosphopantetheinyl transferase superfamily protein [bacterium]
MRLLLVQGVGGLVIVGLGVDIVDVGGFRTRLSDALIEEMFLPAEIAYCSGRGRPWECYAARAAAKQALARAFGRAVSAREWVGSTRERVSVSGQVGGAREAVSGPELAWREVEVVRSPSGDVDLRLTGAARMAALATGAAQCTLSLAHTKRTAMAVVVLESE